MFGGWEFEVVLKTTIQITSVAVLGTEAVEISRISSSMAMNIGRSLFGTMKTSD